MGLHQFGLVVIEAAVLTEIDLLCSAVNTWKSIFAVAALELAQLELLLV